MTTSAADILAASVPPWPLTPPPPSLRKRRSPACTTALITLSQTARSSPRGLSARLGTAFQRAMPPPDTRLSDIRYCHPFRHSQTELLRTVADLMAEGVHQLHIVAPPGAGKTIVGLELVRRIGRRALVLVPGTAIQEQWLQKSTDFGREDLASTDVDSDPPVLVLTYQALAVARSVDELGDVAARLLWMEDLSQSRSMALEEAAERLDRMEEANSVQYRKELAGFKKRLKSAMLEDPDFDLMRLLHPGARALIERLTQAGIGTIVLDECHHLTGLWAVVVGELITRLQGPVVVGLTATPPVERDNPELNRYLDLVGDIDIEIPAPALVKEGQLAPYQDLVYLTHPTDRETAFIDTQHRLFRQLIARLRHQDPTFIDWLGGRIEQGVGPELTMAIVKLLRGNRLTIGDWTAVLEDYALNHLKLSDSPESHQRHEDLCAATRSLGLLLTEKGFRRTVSPVDRVLGLSESKLQGMTTILAAENATLGDRLRALVLVDYEKTSATALREVRDVLDQHAGGALAVVRALVKDETGNLLDPIMVTGSTVLCDNDVVERFLDRGRQWAAAQNLDITLRAVPVKKLWLHEIRGSGADWGPGTYTGLVTTCFEEGLTRCLVGTRGLLGEGWDAVSVTTLVDLTSVTAYTAVNQVRGRSLRLNPREARKVANNWDVVCMAPEYEEGFNDYERFVRKHDGFYGLCDDGQIARGVEHVHPDFTGASPLELDGRMDAINQAMLEQVAGRERVYRDWRIAEPYQGVEGVSADIAVEHRFGPRPVNIQQGGWEDEIDIQGPRDRHHLGTQQALQAMATVILNTLAETGELSAPYDASHIHASLRRDGFYSFSLSSAHPADAARFASALLTVISPVVSPSWLMPRYELEVHSTDELDGVSPSQAPRRLVSWHAVPGRSREFAAAFDRHWKRLVSPGDPLSVRKPDGAALLEEWRGQNPLGVKSRNRFLWH